MKISALAAAFLLLGLIAILRPLPAAAQTDPAPDINQSFSGCYRSLVQADDLFCLTRYELPTKVTAAPVSPEAWCAVLVDTEGCIDNPVDPVTPTSLLSGAAFITLYKDATLLGQGQAQRIGHTIGGLYFPAGHGVTWGDPTVQGCVESSVSLFTTTSSDCSLVVWNTADNTATAQRAKLGVDLVAQMLALETVDPLIPNGGYVVNNRINDAGRDLALEALNVIDSLLRDTFRSGSFPAITDPFATPSSQLELQNSINATATAMVGSYDDTGAIIGVPGAALGMILATIFGVGAFVFTWRKTEQNAALATVAFLTFVLAGVLISAVPVAVMAVTAVLIFAAGGVFFLRKLGLV